ncbi:MAG: glycosyltransferase [Candidatus Burarchaeum sp.]|nr:glycosyltransferase [Candidatus Burarchaeum sp.]MDO8339056.1 glycosyltransferase [Candidatus Burarchaeum sp.]
MKLAIVAPFSTKAALSFRIFNIAKQMKQKPAKIIFHARDRYGTSERQYENQENLWWKKSLWLLKLHAWQIAWKVRDCDVIYFFKPLPLNYFAAWLLKNVFGKKVIFDFDEWEPYTQQEYVKGGANSARNRIACKTLDWIGHACANLSCCITTSNRRINDEILHHRKCLLMPNGVDFEEYAMQGGKLRKFELRKEVAYAGSLHYAALLLPFFLQVPKGFKLHIWGDGRAREEIEYALKQKGIDHEFHGYLKPDQLSRELKKFHGIFLAPYMPLLNIEYSSAGKMPQYMALGQPVIVSKVEGPMDFLMGKNCAYLVEPGREREIGKLIEAIYADKKGAERKARLAQEIVRQNFDWRKMCAKLERFIAAC